MADIDFIIEFPVANPVKMILDGESSDQRARFDQVRYSNAEFATIQPRKFDQPFEKADPIRLQFYTNYPQQRVRVIDCDGNVVIDLTPTIATVFRNRKYRSDCKFASFSGKLFVYFEEGFEYADEDFTVQGDFITLNGVTPNINAEVGNIVRYDVQGTGINNAQIEQIAWHTSLQVEGFVLDVSSALITPVDGVIEITYNEKDADLYQQLINLSTLTEGRYFIRAEFGLVGFTKSWTSEPLDVRESHPKTLAVIYRHEGEFDDEDIWGYLYLQDWTNTIRVSANLHALSPAGDVEVFTEDFGRQQKTRAVPFREITFRALNLPSWVVDKLNVIFAHDTLILNGYQWEVQDFGQLARIERSDIGTFEISLRQVDDRTTYRRTFPEALTAAFDPASFSAIAFAGDSLQAVFSSNTDSWFRFLSLPSWITTDHDEYGFEDGDTITFFIAANATFFERQAIMMAAADDFPELQAQVSFQQDFDTTEPLFIDVNDHLVTLAGSSGANQLLNVSSSGDYDIVHVSGFAFTVAKESGFTQLRITAPSQNNGPSARTAQYRLELHADPSVFVIVDVSQGVFVGMQGISPGLIQIGPSGGNPDIFSITVTTGVQWQMLSNVDWIIVDNTIRTGSVSSFTQVFVAGKSPFVPPRTGMVTFYNISNPADAVTLTIEQTD